MRGVRAAVALAGAFGAFATPAFADTTGPKLVVAGTLLRADGATVDAAPLTIDPAASDPDGVRSIALTVDGVPVAGPGPWRIDPKDYGDGARCGSAAAARSSSTARDRVIRPERLWPRSGTSTATGPRTCSWARRGRAEPAPRSSSAGPAAGVR